MQRKTLMLVLMIAAAVIALALVAVVIWQTVAPPRTPAPEAPAQTAQTQAETPAQIAITPPDASATAEDTVRLYFTYWNARSAEGMNACRVAADAGHVYDDLQYEAAVELLRCEAQSDELAFTGFNAEWYQNAADVAYVLTDYTVRYNEAGKAFFLRDTSDRAEYGYWLVKETADGGWRIVMEGY